MRNKTNMEHTESDFVLVWENNCVVGLQHYAAAHAEEVSVDLYQVSYE